MAPAWDMVRILLPVDQDERPAARSPIRQAQAAPQPQCSPAGRRLSMFGGCCGWRIEQGCKITKRAGWQWQRTRMEDPDRAARLWLAVAVATLWLLLVGGEADDTIPDSTLLDLTPTLAPSADNARPPACVWSVAFDAAGPASSSPCSITSHSPGVPSTQTPGHLLQALSNSPSQASTMTPNPKTYPLKPPLLPSFRCQCSVMGCGAKGRYQRYRQVSRLVFSGQ